MPRGVVLDFVDDAETVARAESLLVVPTDRQARIWYLSEPGRNGGSDPLANTCASIWRDKEDTKDDPAGKVWCTADCVGFGCWCAGFDRYQPQRCVTMDWVNQNSMVGDARLVAAGKPGMFRFCDPRPGCFAVIVDERYTDPTTGKEKLRVGHVGVVTRQLAGVWYCAHCSPSNHKRVDQAIAETTVRVAMGARKVYFLERVR